MAELNGDPHHITVANLPQNIKGGIKIHGFSSPSYDLPKDAVLLFTHLEGSEAVCKVEGTKNSISIDPSTPIVELGGDEWQVEPAKEDAVDA